MIEIIETVFDAVKDALVIFPFLFFVYVLMEMIEAAGNKEKIERALAGGGAPLFAALTGVIPECGFSVACAKLFDGGLITVGTLVAAFIATSDEGIVILLSAPNGVGYALLLMAIKILYAAFIGVLLNILLKNFGKKHVCPVKDDCVECGERHEKFFDKFVAHPFYHAAKTFIYVLIVNVALNLVLHFIGEENVFSFIDKNFAVEPVFTALFGLIPNCASSIFLAKGFTYGIISFSGLIAGLSANSGVGMLILLKKGKNIKQNALIMLITYAAGVLIGYITVFIA